MIALRRTAAFTLALLLAGVSSLGARAQEPAPSGSRFGKYQPDPEPPPDEDESEATPETPADAPAEPEQTAPVDEAPASEPAEQPLAPDDAGTVTGAEPEPGAEPAPATSAEAPKRAVELSAAVGAGVSTLSMTRPISHGTQRLPRTTYAGVSFAFRAHAWPKNKISLEALLDYHSSVGLELRSEPLFGLGQDVATRVQRMELSLAPTFRLGDSPRALALAFPVGVSLHTIVPVLHEFNLPNLVMAGPMLRALLLWPLGESVTLRAGPEAHWIPFVDDTLKHQGACCAGYAIGASAVLEAAVGPSFALALEYRQIATSVPSGDRSYDDLERFITALALGKW